MNIRIRIVLTLVLLAVSALSWSQLATAPWPKFHRNNLNTGVGAAGGSNGLQRWALTTGNWIESSAAIGSDGTIYVGADDTNLYAINPDGSLKWTFATGGDVQSSPAIGEDGTIYVGCGNGIVYAVNPNGTEKWTFTTHNPVVSSPAIGTDGTIYVGSWDTILYAINPDGTQKWRFLVGDRIYSSPAIGPDGTIYISVWNHLVYAISSSGKEVWAYAAPATVSSSPAIGTDGTVYFGCNDDNLYALTSAGALSWTAPTKGGIASSPALGADGTIYIGSGDSNLYAFSPAGKQLWSFATGNSISSSPAIDSAGIIYVGSTDGVVYAIYPNGVQKWGFDTFGYVTASPAIGGDGTVYIGSQDHNMYALGVGGTVAVSSFTVNPTSVVQGGTVSGKVNLAKASTDPDIVTLSSDNVAASLSSNVEIAAGGTSTNVAIMTYPVSVVTAVTLTASSGGVQAKATLNVLPASVSLLSLNPTSVIGTGSTTGTVTLSGPAGAAGDLVSLGASNKYATPQASVKVAAGSKTGTFTIDTAPVVANETVTISASFNGTLQTSNLTVIPIGLSGLSVTPASVIGGNPVTGGKVSIVVSAPLGGLTVNLSSNNSAVKTPATTNILQGQETGTFQLTTSGVSTSTTATVTAVLNGSSKACTMTVIPAALSSITLTAAKVIGGSAEVKGQIGLNGQAGSAGTSVQLVSFNTAAATVPANVTVLPGTASASFSATSHPVSVAQLVKITASNGAVSKTVEFTVEPAALSTVKLSVSSLIGGTSAQGLLTLNGAAGPLGATVDLSAGSGVTVPSSVTIEPGKMTAPFVVQTSTVNVNTPVSIDAAFGSVNLTSSLTVLSSVTSLIITPASVVGGNSAEGVVNVPVPAGTSGDVIAISSNSKYAVVQTGVRIAPGEQMASFPIKTRAVPIATVVTITVSYNGSVVKKTLQLLP